MPQTPANTPLIIQATLEHLDLVAPLFNDYRIFYKKESDLAASRAYLQARLEQAESVIYLALRDSDQAWEALGFTQLYPLFSSLSLKRSWVLYDLFVVPEARRQGLAEGLLERAKKLGQESGAAEITLDTAIDNLAAQALYEKFGFARDEEFYTYYLTIP